MLRKIARERSLERSQTHIDWGPERLLLVYGLIPVFGCQIAAELPKLRHGRSVREDMQTAVHLGWPLDSSILQHSIVFLDLRVF